MVTRVFVALLRPEMVSPHKSLIMNTPLSKEYSSSKDISNASVDQLAKEYMLSKMESLLKKNQKTKAARAVRIQRLKEHPQNIRDILRQSGGTNQAAYDAIVTVVQAIISDSRSKPVAHAKALDAGISLYAALRTVNPAFGDRLLSLVREWNGLGRTGNARMDERKEVVMLQHVGLDTGYIEKYERLRSWARNSPEDESAAKKFYHIAMPLLKALAMDCRFDDSARVCRDIRELSKLSDVEKLIAKNQYFALCRESLFEGRLELTKAAQALNILFHNRDESEKDKEIKPLLSDFYMEALLGSVNRSDRSAQKLLNGRSYTIDGLSASQQNEYGWRIAKALKEKAAVIKKPDAEFAPHARYEGHELCRIYLLLEGIEKPSLLHSLVLSRALPLLQDRGLIEFADEWGLATLRDEDFAPWMGRNGRVYPSLVEKLIPALYRALKVIVRQMPRLKHQAEKSVEAANDLAEFRKAIMNVVGFVADNYARYPDQRYFPYYYTRLLQWTSEPEKAREALLGKAISLSDQWWYWSAIADTYAEDPARRLQCLCKAITLSGKNDTQYTVRVHRLIQVIAIELGLAVDEVNIEKHAEEADKLTRQATEQVQGVVLELTRLENASKMSAIINVNGQLGKAEGNYPPQSLGEMVRGAPVEVSVVQAGGKWLILHAKKRKGSAWDILPWEDAVVIATRPARRVRLIRLSDLSDHFISTKHWRSASEWAPGMTLKLKLIRNDGGVSVVKEQVTDTLPPIARHEDGAISNVDSKGVAKLGETLLIPRRIAAPMALRKGARIKGLFVRRNASIEIWEAVDVAHLN
jgi:hypothetical protein